MSKVYAGFDFGARFVKIAVIEDGHIGRASQFATPDNLIKNGIVTSETAMAEFVRECMKEMKIKIRNAAVTLHPQETYTRCVTMPAMTVEQLGFNLPYEFRNYISQDKDKYYYDYSVINISKDDDGRPTQMELLASATLKSTIELYRGVFHRAGMRLRIATPEECSYANVLREPLSAGILPRDGAAICIIDLGHYSTRIHVYRSGVFDVTRFIEYGGTALDDVIAEGRNVDRHMAAVYKESNYEDILSQPYCEDIYQTISVEIMKTLNFYCYNNRDVSLAAVYIIGGGSNILPLTERISMTLSESALAVPTRDISELIPMITDDPAYRSSVAIAGSTEL